MKKAVAGLAVIIAAGYILTSGIGGGLQASDYQVEDWTEDGFIEGGIEVTQDYVYANPSSSGTWSSKILTETGHYPSSASVDGDSSGGEILLRINMWNASNATGSPDRILEREVLTGENNYQFNITNNTYNYFEYELELNKTKSNSQERPNVQEFNAVLDSDRTDYRDFDNLYIIFSLLFLLLGSYAVLS